MRENLIVFEKMLRKSFFQEGKIFWLSGYAGKGRARTGPFNSYFYNNTIFVDEEIVARMALARTAEGVLIANNIFFIRGRSEALSGKRYDRDRSGKDNGRVVFANNLFLSAENWPSGRAASCHWALSSTSPARRDGAWMDFALDDELEDLPSSDRHQRQHTDYWRPWLCVHRRHEDR